MLFKKALNQNQAQFLALALDWLNPPGSFSGLGLTHRTWKRWEDQRAEVKAQSFQLHSSTSSTGLDAIVECLLRFS